MAKILLSMCCDAEALVRGKTTHYYTCSACGEPCDVTQEDAETKSVERAPRDKMMRRAKVRRKAI